MADPVDETAEEEARVLEWRVDVLRRAGIRRGEAWQLAESDADLHAMLRAKAAGCDVAVMVRIFT